MTIDDVAKVCHEANRAYCETLGDCSQPTWEYAPQWQRDSAVSGVRFHLGNPAAGPSGSHQNWLRDKEAAGWKYGPVKDAEKKEHPYCVPFGDLPRAQQVKDYVFTALVHALKGELK